MNWSIHRIASPAALVVRVQGDFDLDESRQMLEAVADEMNDLTFRPVIFDDRDLKVDNVSLCDMIDIRNRFLENNRIFAGRKMAILMSSVSDMEVAATFINMIEPESRFVIDVFQEEREALAWLDAPFCITGPLAFLSGIGCFLF